VTRVIVCGGRDFTNGALLFERLDAAHHKRPFAIVIHGAAKGADTLANQWAMRRGVSRQAVPAEWRKHGKAAGPIRNQKMLDKYAPDLVIAFPGGSGTADMVARARAAGIETIEEAP
jgi:hypothetical protein